MPLLIALLPLVALIAYFSLRSTPAAAAIQPGARGEGGGSDFFASIADALPASVAELPSVESLVEPLEVVMRRAFTIPPAGQAYADAIARTEAFYGIPDTLLARLLYEESRFRPDVITGMTRSGAGAVGIAQFMPATAAGLGVDPLDPVQAINGAGRYLKQMFDRFGDWTQALAAYNWGPGNVATKGMQAAPRETRNYVNAILDDVSV